MRNARVERTTKESSVLVDLTLDGTGEISVDTGVPFFDHMLTLFARHGLFDLDLDVLEVRQGGAVDLDRAGQALEQHRGQVVALRGQPRPVLAFERRRQADRAARIGLVARGAVLGEQRRTIARIVPKPAATRRRPEMRRMHRNDRPQTGRTEIGRAHV